MYSFLKIFYTIDNENEADKIYVIYQITWELMSLVYCKALDYGNAQNQKVDYTYIIIYNKLKDIIKGEANI